MCAILEFSTPTTPFEEEITTNFVRVKKTSQEHSKRFRRERELARALLQQNRELIVDVAHVKTTNPHLITAMASVGCSGVENFNLEQIVDEPTLVVATLGLCGHLSVGGG